MHITVWNADEKWTAVVSRRASPAFLYVTKDGSHDPGAECIHCLVGVAARPMPRPRKLTAVVSLWYSFGVNLVPPR